MSVITAKGTEAKENANKNNLDLKKIFLRLKEGQSHKVKLLGLEDYVEFNSAGDYNLGIYSQPITEASPLLVAHAKGGEKFKSLYKKSRYVFIFGSLETGELVAWECSKTQAKKMLSDIEDYVEDEEGTDTIAFNLKRTGDKTDTVYSLMPIMKKLPAPEQEKFDALKGVKVEPDFYEAILQPKDDKFLAQLLQEAGFDVATHLPHIDLAPDPKEGSEDAKPIDVTDSEDSLLDTI